MNKNKSLSIFSFFLIYLTVCKQTDQSFDDFGLLTMTYQRNEGNQFFKDYLSRYAEMECQSIKQIAIVWNNQFTVERSGILQLQPRWKRPVYFYQTEFNSLSFKYKLTNQSKQIVYFTIDDDIKADCRQLENAFNQWKKTRIGNNGAIASYVIRNVDIDIQTDLIAYYPAQANYYSISITGAAFVSRQLMDLYNSDALQSLIMNNYVRQNRNCQDIMSNLLMSKYYPYFHPVFINKIPVEKGGNLNIGSGPNAISKKKDHYIARDFCVHNFVHFVGQTPIMLLKQVDVIQKYFWKLPASLHQKIVITAGISVKKMIQNQKLQKVKKQLYKFSKKLEEIYSLNQLSSQKEDVQGFVSQQLNTIFMVLNIFMLGTIIAILFPKDDF